MLFYTYFILNYQNLYQSFVNDNDVSFSFNSLSTIMMKCVNFWHFSNDVRCQVCILDAPSLWKRPHESPSSAAKKENLALSTCIQERPIHHGRLGLIYQFEKSLVSIQVSWLE